MPGDPTRDGPQDCGLGMDPGAQRIPPDGLVNQRRARERLPVLTTAGPDLALGGTPRPSSGASRQRRSVSRRTGTAGGGYVGVVPSTAAPREELLVDLRRARDHMDTHFSEPVDLQQLATIAALSKYYFHRLFTAVYGRTPATYLSERRIERAQDLLRATNLTAASAPSLARHRHSSNGATAVAPRGSPAATSSCGASPNSGTQARRSQGRTNLVELVP